MRQEEQELIIKDLCTRLPYGVKAYIKIWSKLKGEWVEGIYTVRSIDPLLNDIYTSTENGSVGVILGHSDYSIEPYLFPLSSMTDEQKNTFSGKVSILNSFIDGSIYLSEDEELTPEDLIEIFDFLNKNHFDYRGLIPMGLAIDCTNLNIY